MKRLILSILTLIPLWSLAQNKYRVTGKIQLGAPNGRAYLYYRNENKLFRDSGNIENGKFQFSGLIANPIKAVIAISPKGTPIANVDKADKIVVYLEKGDIVIETKDSLISHAKLSGTILNKERQELTDSLGSLSKSSKSYQSKTDAFILKHPGSFVSLNVLRAEINPGTNTERAQKMLDALSPALRNTTEGKNYQGWINAVVAVSVGHMAPSFTSKNPDDKPVSLESYRGKYVLIDFWASWCGPCRQENPNLIAAYEKYKAKNFNILGVSLDGGTNGKKLWIDAIKKDGLTWEQVSDLNGGDGKIPKMYMVEIIPSNFLIDPSGKIIAKNLRGKELDKKLAELLGS